MNVNIWNKNNIPKKHAEEKYLRMIYNNIK
jgi:hypothetical protein